MRVCARLLLCECGVCVYVCIMCKYMNVCVRACMCVVYMYVCVVNVCMCT